jgi:hypothetical protein
MPTSFPPALPGSAGGLRPPSNSPQSKRAIGAPSVGTDHLLGGILAEANNLALIILRSMEIEPRDVQDVLDRQSAAAGPPERAPSAADASDPDASSPAPPLVRSNSPPWRRCHLATTT